MPRSSAESSPSSIEARIQEYSQRYGPKIIEILRTDRDTRRKWVNERSLDISGGRLHEFNVALDMGRADIRVYLVRKNATVADIQAKGDPGGVDIFIHHDLARQIIEGAK